MRTSIARFAKSKFFIPGIVIIIFIIGWLFFIVSQLWSLEEKVIPINSNLEENHQATSSLEKEIDL